MSINWRSVNSASTKHDIFQVISKNFECETNKKLMTNIKHTKSGTALNLYFEL